MQGEVKIYEQGLEECPKSGIIVGNMVMMAWIALGTVACWLLYPLAAWIYLPAAVVLVFVVLRGLVCTNCYYYGKWCPIGWGKLSALFFKKGSVERFGTSAGVRLAPMVYGLLSLVPIVLIVVALVREFSVAGVVVLVLLLVVFAYSGAVSRTRACTHCKMRLICPGCAAKAS